MQKPLEDLFGEVYSKFKLQFYKRIFQRLDDREATLTLVESYSIEVINALGNPTVSEFATFLEISKANATYKVQNLIRKGYLEKVRSEQDRRESHLHVTERFREYEKLNNTYLATVAARVRATCAPEEVELLQSILNTISTELMPEVDLH